MALGIDRRLVGVLSVPRSLNLMLPQDHFLLLLIQALLIEIASSRRVFVPVIFFARVSYNG